MVLCKAMSKVWQQSNRNSCKGSKSHINPSTVVYIKFVCVIKGRNWKNQELRFNRTDMNNRICVLWVTILKINLKLA